MTNGYDESIAAHDGTKLVGFGPRRFDATHSRAVIDAETCTPEEAEYWGVYRLDSHGLPPHALGRPEYAAQRPDRAGAREYAEQWAERLDRGRALSYGYDTHILDAAGRGIKRASYGPRRPESDDPNAHIEACLPAEAMFWGVYQHNAEGLAAIVGDAFDEISAKSFAEQVARNLEHEERLLAAINSPPHGDEAASRALRLKQGMPRYIVDGHEFRNDESNYMSDGRYPPFVVFDVDLQENLPGEFGTRAEAEEVAASKNAEHPRRVILAIDTNTAAFKDLGHACEVARLLRDAGRQLQTAPDMDSVRLVDTNDNEVGWLYAAEVEQDLESSGMVHLVVEAGEDRAFGTTEADRMALAETFQRLGNHLDEIKDFSKRVTAFPVEVREAPYERNSRVTDVKVGQFYYTPALEPEALHALRAAGVPEI